MADAYAGLVAPRYAPIAALLDAAVGPVAPGARVVELAAGTGALTRLLAPRVPAADGDYHAVDISNEMLRRSRAAVGARVEVVVADGQATTLADSSADLVVSLRGTGAHAGRLDEVGSIARRADCSLACWVAGRD